MSNNSYNHKHLKELSNDFSELSKKYLLASRNLDKTTETQDPSSAAEFNLLLEKIFFGDAKSAKRSTQQKKTKNKQKTLDQESARFSEIKDENTMVAIIFMAVFLECYFYAFPETEPQALINDLQQKIFSEDDDNKNLKLLIDCAYKKSIATNSRVSVEILGSYLVFSAFAIAILAFMAISNPIPFIAAAIVVFAITAYPVKLVTGYMMAKNNRKSAQKAMITAFAELKPENFVRISAQEETEEEEKRDEDEKEEIEEKKEGETNAAKEVRSAFVNNVNNFFYHAKNPDGLTQEMLEPQILI